ncbi:hypothetical protein DSO57_1029471 [Entomophthora muscae]|uniref:Uncharacterized protein n=2 Tax=Entomophthora muscae TaxID=34485 RepID=A0ACC2TE94_9FUNG|nr:hypothetical protein DSO57_1022797 [Entomophthora muscae]KAJ9080021.1 hypothetical protein DSO57_1029471 [Entomophthora muscae]
MLLIGLLSLAAGAKLSERRLKFRQHTGVFNTGTIFTLYRGSVTEASCEKAAKRLTCEEDGFYFHATHLKIFARTPNILCVFSNLGTKKTQNFGTEIHYVTEFDWCVDLNSSDYNLPT